MLRKDNDDSENSPFIFLICFISASKKQQNVLKAPISSKRKLDNRPLETPPLKVRAAASSKISVNSDDNDTTKFTVQSGGLSGGLLNVREDRSQG